MAAAVAPAAVAVTDLGAGQIRVEGALTFTTAREARAAGAKLLHRGAGPALVIDCGGVNLSDSAGLAVLDRLARARQAQRPRHPFQGTAARTARSGTDKRRRIHFNSKGLQRLRKTRPTKDRGAGNQDAH